ncbi:hypothetical protein ACFFGH_24360 [Lysobacter korlensis]|uniref:Uncharacterized protein n=1 Tax=Lysobacter korlensis TaxID=553636 RepID=A0ABV6RVH2_9GAMM
MSAVIETMPGQRVRNPRDAERREESQARLEALLERAEPLANTWAERYDWAWAIEAGIARDAKVWSVETAHDIVRHVRTPYASLAVASAAALATGTGNLVMTLLLMPQLGMPAASLLAAPGVVVSGFGVKLAVRYAGMVAQHRAGIPPFRLRLQAELHRHAVAAIDRRRERLAGPRRPIPRHTFPDLLPVQAQNVAAGWMRHLGELDATVLRPAGTFDLAPALPAEQAHVLSSGYVARVWAFTAETPDVELGMLEDAAKATGKRPLLFSLSGFPEPVVVRANRRGIALFTYSPWRGTLVARSAQAERCLARGLRGASGFAT